MTLLQWLSAQPLVHSIGWTLIHFLWQGAVLGAAFALAHHWLRDASANARYAVGVATLLLMAIAPVVTLFVVQGSDPWLVASAPAADVGWGLALSAPVADGSLTGFLTGAMPWLVAAWFAGVLALAARFCAGWWQVQSLRRRGVTPPPGWVVEIVTRLAADLRVPVRVQVLLSALVDSPTVIGWLRPVILLPASVVTGLTPQQLEMVVAHELGHVRRFDYLVNLVQVLIGMLLFYHPAVRWVSEHVRIERENCCDDIVIALTEDRVGYVRALAALESERTERTLALAMAATGGSLLGRIRRLFGQPDTQTGRARVGWIAAISAGALVVATVVAVRPWWTETETPVEADVVELARVEEPAPDAALSTPPPTAPDLRALLDEPVVTPVPQEMSDRGLAEDMARASRSIATPSQLPRPEVRVATTLAPLPAPMQARRADPVPAPAPAKDDAREVDEDAEPTPGVIDAAHSRPAMPSTQIELVVTKLPDALHTPAPDYPVAASRRGIQGAVTAAYVVAPDGTVDEVKILGAVGGDVFTEEVMRTLATWRFEPTPNGRYVEAVQTFRFEPVDDATAARECAVTGSRLCRQRRNWVTAEQRQNVRVITTHASVGAASPVGSR